MNAAASSWRTWMKRILSWRVRSASMIPLMPSPGRPKMTSTPQSRIVSISTSAAVLAMICFLLYFLGCAWRLEGDPEPLVERRLGVSGLGEEQRDGFDRAVSDRHLERLLLAGDVECVDHQWLVRVGTRVQADETATHIEHETRDLGR